jgi:hypothetical protein
MENQALSNLLQAQYSGFEMFQMPQEQQPVVEPIEPKAELLDKSQEDFGGSKFLNYLNKLGIEGNDIAMNDFGRINLLKKLEQKYGPGYQKESNALDALSLFDSEMQKISKESITSGQRTLRALFGG